MNRGSRIMRRFMKMSTKARRHVTPEVRELAKEQRENRRRVAQMRAMGVDEDGVLPPETS